MEIKNDPLVDRLHGIFGDKVFPKKNEYGLKNNIEEDKAQMSLLPLDLLAELLEPAYREGLVKYERESWRKGFKASVMMDAALRHISAFYFWKEDYDPETLDKYGISKPHLGAAIFCLISMYNSVHNHVGLDDRPVSILKEEREDLDNFDKMDKVINININNEK